NGPNSTIYHFDDMEMLAPVNTNPNLILNGGFEQTINTGTPDEGFNNWGKWNGPNDITSTTVAGEFRTGARAVKVVPSSSATQAFNVQLVSDPVNTVVGAQYTFNIYAKRASSSVSATSTIRFSTNGGTALFSGNYTPGTDWTLHTWTFVANNATTRIALDLGGSGAGVATYFLDDASLQVVCGSFVFSPPSTQTPIAQNKEKWIGSVYQSSLDPNFARYFNQITPENAGEWGSVETTNGTYNWATMDAIIDYAAANNMKSRFHVLLWGNQQPTWLKSMSDAQKVQKIKEWMQAVANRYNGIIKPKFDYVEVLNEVLNDPPDNLGTNIS
ncbi:MAG TPA: endo-1,4-beta-xylanase, partial [Saprospiraceae bacterium]|nr:endo-1,4-beta-xylanase [Saprospiraceae bacterium]